MNTIYQARLFMIKFWCKNVLKGMILDIIALFLFDAIQGEILILILIILSDVKYNGITKVNFSNIYNKYM